MPGAWQLACQMHDASGASPRWGCARLWPAFCRPAIHWLVPPSTPACTSWLHCLLLVCPRRAFHLSKLVSTSVKWDNDSDPTEGLWGRLGYCGPSDKPKAARPRRHAPKLGVCRLMLQLLKSLPPPSREKATQLLRFKSVSHAVKGRD